MLRQLIFGRRRAADGNGSQDATLCERLCQLPNYLSGEGSARGPFVTEPGVGVARMVSVHNGLGRDNGNWSEGSKESAILSTLRMREAEEANALSKYLLADDQMEPAVGDKLFHDADEICGICTINECTHYALPCKHSACRVCWSRWLADHKACMTCALPVEHLRRYPISTVPLSLYEIESGKCLEQSKHDIRACSILVEQSLERCIRSMLAVKDSMNTVAENFHTVESHLIGITRPEPGTRVTVDMLTSVLAVERSSVVEQLDEYEKVFAQGKLWALMEREVHVLISSVKRFSSLLDNFLESRSPNSTAEGDADGEMEKSHKSTKDDLPVALEVFEILVAPTSILAQWGRVRTLLETCGPNSHLIPGIVRVFGMIHFNNLPSSEGTRGNPLEIPRRAGKIMSDAQTKQLALDALITEDLLQESSVILERIRSMI